MTSEEAWDIMDLFAWLMAHWYDDDPFTEDDT